MSELAKAYGIDKHNEKKSSVEGISFGFHHSGVHYSYVTIIYSIKGKRYYEQLSTEDFFNWVGKQLLKI
jgi:hypothetical protein